MGPKQSSPSAELRVRSFSGGDAAVLRYYAGGSTGQIGERVQFSPHRPAAFTRSAIIPTGGRRDETDGPMLFGSLPAHLTPHLLGAGFDCPFCSKFVCSDDIDVHLPMCFFKHRLDYNDDVLSQDSGECSICLDDMIQGDTIARLPCLCIYHKGCIDEWFEVNRSCPEHPTD